MKWVILITIGAIIGLAFFAALVRPRDTYYYLTTDEDPLANLGPIEKADDAEPKD